MELLHRRRRRERRWRSTRRQAAAVQRAGGGGGAGSSARGAGAGGGAARGRRRRFLRVAAWRVWAAAERGAGAGHRTGRRRCGRWGEKVGREKRLGFEVDLRAVIVCTNLKHWKVSWKKSCGRWIGFLGGSGAALVPNKQRARAR